MYVNTKNTWSTCVATATEPNPPFDIKLKLYHSTFCKHSRIGSVRDGGKCEFRCNYGLDKLIVPCPNCNNEVTCLIADGPSHRDAADNLGTVNNPDPFKDQVFKLHPDSKSNSVTLDRDIRCLGCNSQYKLEKGILEFQRSFILEASSEYLQKIIQEEDRKFVQVKRVKAVDKAKKPLPGWLKEALQDLD